MSYLEADGRQQQKATLGSTPVSQKQGTVGTGWLKRHTVRFQSLRLPVSSIHSGHRHLEEIKPSGQTELKPYILSVFQ